MAKKRQPVQPQSTSLALLRQDVEDFLITWNKEVFYNERELQMNLAMWLKCIYKDVYIEYYIPKPKMVFNNYQNTPLIPYPYVWDSEMKLDIVVKIDDFYYPIELKYKTRELDQKLFPNGVHIERFNENPLRDYYGNALNIGVLKNQSAQNLGRYDFWKDVRRVELTVCRFNKTVKGGLSIFVTNDMTYMKTQNNANYAGFSMMDIGQAHSNKKYWTTGTALTTTSGRPDFDTYGYYETKWWKMGNINPNNKMYVAPIGSPQYVNPKQIPNNDGLTLCYCIVEIPPCNSSSASAKPDIDDNRSELIHKNKK